MVEEWTAISATAALLYGLVAWLTTATSLLRLNLVPPTQTTNWLLVCVIDHQIFKASLMEQEQIVSLVPGHSNAQHPIAAVEEPHKHGIICNGDWIPWFTLAAAITAQIFVLTKLNLASYKCRMVTSLSVVTWLPLWVWFRVAPLELCTMHIPLSAWMGVSAWVISLVVKARHTQRYRSVDETKSVPRYASIAEEKITLTYGRV